MKTILALILTIISLQVYAWPVDQNGNRLITLDEKTRCVAKGDVTMFTYRHRDSIPLEKMLDIMQEDWDEVWSKEEAIKHATYVDMQRIIHDAYRTNNRGEFIRECCTEEIEQQRTGQEIILCINQGY